jgi:hypothetical protein
MSETSDQSVQTPKSESELSDTNSTLILLLNRINYSFLSKFYIGVYFYFLGCIIRRKVLTSDPSEVLDCGINFLPFKLLD